MNRGSLTSDPRETNGFAPTMRAKWVRQRSGRCWIKADPYSRWLATTREAASSELMLYRHFTPRASCSPVSMSMVAYPKAGGLP